MSADEPTPYEHTIYEQRVWLGDPPPREEGWRALGCYGTVAHNPNPPLVETHTVVVWVRSTKDGLTALERADKEIKGFKDMLVREFNREVDDAPDEPETKPV